MKPRRMTILTVLAALMLFGAGCGGAWTPEAKLLAARHTFSGAVRAVTVLADENVFSEDEENAIDLLIDVGLRTLNRWDAAIELKESTRGWVREFNMILRELVAYRIAAERKKTNGP